MPRPRHQRLLDSILLSIAILGLCPAVVAADALPVKPNEPAPRQIAFMPDIHFHDVYAEFEDGSFSGLENSESGKLATIRTMQAQLHSTRLFNENYFALLAALDDMVARGIQLVALPGDFSDDGQPIHIRGLRKILDHYSENHGIEFFATPGNHDPVRPFDTPGGKADFLGTDGHSQRIFSRGVQECMDYEGSWTKVDTGRPLETICTEEITLLGYQKIMEQLADFGFYPKPGYRHWETPYSSPGEYRYQKARIEADYQNRQYEICQQGKGGVDKEESYTHCTQVPDASYLVEPVPGLWLLSIDANVYVPKAADTSEGKSLTFESSGNAGYNRMLTHKSQVLDWIADVVERANASGKHLIAFSHYPMVEFYNGQSDTLAQLFGSGSSQLKRQPRSHVSQALADTGLKLHVGGHMHMNDTGVVPGADGNTLVNVQAPSLAAYVPAYKLMTLHSDQTVEVETIVLDQVPRFSELFEHYRTEYKALKKAGETGIWDKGILDAENYREFTLWHIRELTRHRFLPNEWPEEFRKMLLSLTGRELLALTQLNSQTDLTLGLDALKQSPRWRKATETAAKHLHEAELDAVRFDGWTGFDLAVDFYRLRNAGTLAIEDIGPARLKEYRFLSSLASSSELTEPNADSGSLVHSLGQLMAMLEVFQEGQPDDHFILDLKSGKIVVQ